MPRHCVRSQNVSSSTSSARRRESILRSQTTGDYTVETHTTGPHQPKVTATNVASTSEILSGRGVQTRPQMYISDTLSQATTASH